MVPNDRTIGNCAWTFLDPSCPRYAYGDRYDSCGVHYRTVSMDDTIKVNSAIHFVLCSVRVVVVQYIEVWHESKHQFRVQTNDILHTE